MDTTNPNATINPDYVAYNVTLRDGTTINGFVRAQTSDLVRLTTADGKEIAVSRADLTDLRPSLVSLMPSGLLDGVTEGQVRDLLTFLLNQAPVHSLAEVDVFRRAESNHVPSQPHSTRTLNIVLVASKQDHGPGQHDYPAWQKAWRKLLRDKSGVNVADAWEWPTPEQWLSMDLVVFYFWNHEWSPKRLRQMDEYFDRSGGVVMLHSATIADKDPEALAARIGLAAQPGPTKYLHSPFILRFVASTNHLIMSGFTKLDLLDEPYWPMMGDTNRIQVLATADLEGHSWPLVWTYTKGRGSVFASVPGHYSWTFDDPLFRILVLRGMAWVVGEPINRLE